MRQAFAHRLSMRAPDDVAALLAAIKTGQIIPSGIVGILGKTEGNGCVNDFTRAFAVRALRDALLPHIGAEALEHISIVMSGGTEGALAPHMLVLEEREVDGGSSPALAIGSVRTGDLPWDQLGRAGQAHMVAEGVKAAMRKGGITSPDDVHFVQVKCPLLTAERIAATEVDGGSVAVRDTLKSMALSRGASALGVGIALGEIASESVVDGMIGTDMSAWSSRASTSGGVELTDHEIVVIGMSTEWSGDLVVDHAVMTDQIDVEPVRECLKRLDFDVDGQIKPAQRDRVLALLAKAEAGSTGSLRGHRHTMLDDSDIASTRHARAFVGGVLASVVGHAEIYVSGGAEHQGPDGGGPVAVIARRSTFGSGKTRKGTS